ncbi:PrsW family intramembrane metalloprotease [Corynebacterium diphtheriae]|nr:PrsW family intramembrane metalloprotease [Corynebacterium diphtheriae]
MVRESRVFSLGCHLVVPPVDHSPNAGVFIGAFTRLGFQVTEDIWYAINSAYVDINSDLSNSVTLSLVRGLFGLISHWAYTDVVAVGLAYLFGVTFRATNGATLGRGGAIVRAIGLCLLAYLAHGR